MTKLRFDQLVNVLPGAKDEMVLAKQELWSAIERGEKAERVVEAVRKLAFSVVTSRALTGGEVLEAIRCAEAGK